MVLTYTIKKIGGKRIKSKRTGKLGKKRKVRYIVMERDSTRSGFGSVVIRANKATRKQARAWINANK